MVTLSETDILLTYGSSPPFCNYAISKPGKTGFIAQDFGVCVHAPKANNNYLSEMKYK